MGDRILTLPNGWEVPYNDEWNFNKTLTHINEQSKRYEIGVDVRRDVGVSPKMRMFLKSDAYQAQKATLEANFKYVAAIVSTIPKMKVSIPGSLEAMRVENAVKALKETGIEPDPFSYEMTNMPEVNWVVQNEDGVIHIIDEEQFSVGDITQWYRPAVTEAADIAGGAIAAAATGGGSTAVGALARQIPAQAGGSGLAGAVTKEIVNFQFNQFGREDPRSVKDRINSFIGEFALRAGTQAVGEAGMAGGRAGIKSALTMSPGHVFGGKGRRAIEESREAFGSSGIPSGVLAGDLVRQGEFPARMVTQERFGGFWTMFEGWLAKTPFANSMIGNRLRDMHTNIINNAARIMGYDSSTTRRLTGEYAQRVFKGEIQPMAEKGTVADTFAGGYLDVLDETVGVDFKQMRKNISAQHLHPDVESTLRQIIKEASRDPMAAAGWGSKSTRIGQYLTAIEGLLMRSGKGARKGSIRAQLGDVTKLKKEVQSHIAREGGDSGFLQRIRKGLSEAEEIGFNKGGERVEGFRKLKRKWWKANKNFEETIKHIAEAETPEAAWNKIRTWTSKGDLTHIERLFDDLGETVNVFDDNGRRVMARMLVAEATHTPDMAKARTPKQIALIYRKIFKGGTKDVWLPKGTNEREAFDRLINILEHRMPDYEISKNPLFAQAMLTGGFGGAAVSGGYSAGGGGSAWDTAKSALVGGLMGAIGGATMMGTFTYGSGKLITSNMFVDWLARGVELKPGALGSHLVALAERAAMQNDPYLEQAVGEYLTNVMSILGSQEEKNKAGVINIPKGAMAPPPQTNVINPGALLNQRRE